MDEDRIRLQVTPEVGSVDFTRNWIDARLGARRRERVALADYRPAERDGLTEDQVLARLAELEGVLSPDDSARVQILFSRESSDVPVSPRTRRHWVHELLSPRVGTEENGTREVGTHRL